LKNSEKLLRGGHILLTGIRGAISVERDSKEEIEEAVSELLKSIFERNKIEVSKIASVIFSVTPDIKSYNPATAAREKLNLDATPLMCLSEAIFDNSPEMIIRVLILYNADETFKVNHVYLKRAQSLRPDISKINSVGGAE